jgi:hypothetical protein
MGSQFICTTCKEKIEYSNGFPYDLNWTYLHKFNFKLNGQSFGNAKDKHFCSKKCMLEYLKIMLDMADNVNDTERDSSFMDLEELEIEKGKQLNKEASKNYKNKEMNDD